MGFEPTLTHPELQGNAPTNCTTKTMVTEEKNIHDIFSYLSLFTNSATNTDDIVRKTGSSVA